MIEAKFQALEAVLDSLESVLIGYSGGVDSTFLAWVSHQRLGEKSIAVIADSPSLPRAELEEALQIARQFGFPVRIIETQELADTRYQANPVNRCYFCKAELFQKLQEMAAQEGVPYLLYGENASDSLDLRHGSRAATEFQVRAPLKEVGLKKEEIRELSARFGLPTAEKPEMACLSSRIPFGEVVSPTKLRMIENAEAWLKSRNLRQVRVRFHEYSTGSLARIEVAPEEMSGLLTGPLKGVCEAFKEMGFRWTTLDLAGYRRGDLNPLPPPVTKESL